MRMVNMLCAFILVFCGVGLIMEPAVSVAAEKYTVDTNALINVRKCFDDPSPMADVPQKFLPPGVYKRYSYDIEKMKALQAKAVGFKAPDLVGKIAPEITPGKYSYQDKGNKPGLKALMIPFMYEQLFKPGAPPLAGCFSEFELVPTRQYYNCLPQLELTLKNEGKTKVDAQGFWDWKTWEGGIPFPKPSGSERLRAMQAIYNWNFRHIGVDSYVSAGYNIGWDSRFNKIGELLGLDEGFMLANRCTDPPFGWYDARAKERGELKIGSAYTLAPRDSYGNCLQFLMKMDTNEAHQIFMYAALIRRVRKLTGTDSQDTGPGVNIIMDDANGFNRKLSPTQFPYEYKILAEREYLLPAWSLSTDAKAFYMASKNLEFHNFKLERRPVYVIEMTQKDPSYVYSKTIIYIDKELFQLAYIENFDKKGKLWRTYLPFTCFEINMGMRGGDAGINWDVQSKQSSFAVPANFVPLSYRTREDYSLASMTRFGK